MPIVTRTRHIFGKAIQYRWTALAEDEEYEPYELVNARLYLTAPTDVQRADSAGALGGFEGAAKTTWVEEFEREKVITFDTLTDADPHSSDEYKIGYVVVNYRAESAGPVLISEEAILIWRPNAITSRIRIIPSDLYELEGKIEALTDGDVWTQPKIDAAKRYLFQRLKSLDYQKRRMMNLEELNDACLRLALSYCCRDLAGQDNDFWLTKAKEYRDEFEQIFSQTKINYDADGDGVATPDETISIYPVWMFR